MAKTLFESTSPQLSHLLGQIEMGKLALPELQRPFVWQKAAIRDLLDSMYRGFPVGYLMLWSTSDVDSRAIGTGGKAYEPTEFIIDGQQRLTSLYAVMTGSEVIFKDFSRGRIRIAFRPRDGQFAVADAAIEKDPEFLPNITELWTGQNWEVVNAFVERLRLAKPEALGDGGEGRLRDALGRVTALKDYPFDAVRIKSDVNEELVAEIFLRVNSGGTKLTQADFILTMLSVFRDEDRRRLESFARAARIVPTPGGDPSPYNHLVTPDADQLLRVAVLVAFRRGRLQSVLALLRGGSLDGDDALDAAAKTARFDQLSEAISDALDLTAWHEYLKALLAAGFRRSTEITSANNVVLVYALYLIGHRTYGLSHSALRTTISRFFFMSSLTGRYTGSFETRITQDVQNFTQARTGEEYLGRLRQAIDTTLTPDFWSITLPHELATSASRGPALFAYAASLCLLGARVPPFVEKDSGEQKAAIPISSLFDPALVPKKAAVERHHLFPRAYLAKHGIVGVNRINQIANLCYVEWPENIDISDAAPSEYWPKYAGQFTAEDRRHHALPDNWHTMGYEPFLAARRRLIAEVIRDGFASIGDVPDAGSTGTSADAYLGPKTPFANDLAIRKVIRKLEGKVFWYEQHMPDKALEVLHEELRLDRIDAVELMSGPANVTSKAKKRFARFAEELSAQGVACEWRVLPKERAQALHARVIADDDEIFEVPPLNSILKGSVDSIRASEIPLESFRAAWDEDGVPLAAFQPVA